MVALTVRRLPLLCVVALLPATAFAARLASPGPGGPAPKALRGTWHTTLTKADQDTAAIPAHVAARWTLVIVNGKYLTYARALGLRPTGQGGDTVPFGVKGHRIYLSCLDSNAAPSSGFGTYSWSVSGGALRFRVVNDRCTNPDRRNYVAILTSEAWHRIGS
jgi:hypothetical protein